MRRAIARRMGWWMRLFLVSVVAIRFLDLPAWLELGGPVVLFALAWIRPRPDGEPVPATVAAPVRGRWTALNSPGTKVPSHGIRAYGQTYAIDLLRPRPADGPQPSRWGLGMRRPEAFDSFGAPVLAMADGVVVHASDGQRDHRSRESWWALLYLMTLEGAVRETGGARFVLGNHVVVDHGDGTYAAYAHLRRRSCLVEPGDRVTAGQQLAEIGNSGNSSEPHLHVQLMDRPVVTEAAGIPFRWRDITVVPGEVDTTHVKTPASSTDEGVPADGQVFVAA